MTITLVIATQFVFITIFTVNVIMQVTVVLVGLLKCYISITVIILCTVCIADDPVTSGEPKSFNMDTRALFGVEHR